MRIQSLDKDRHRVWFDVTPQGNGIRMVNEKTGEEILLIREQFFQALGIKEEVILRKIDSGSVFSLPECVYEYCPDPEECKEKGCAHPLRKAALSEK